MTALRVDRLTLDAGALGESDARRLAELVAAALLRWPAAPDASGRVERVTATVRAPAPGESVERLADRIGRAVLDAVVEELRR